MKMFILLLGIVLFFYNCSNDAVENKVTTRQANVTLLATHTGLGDNGYNDQATKGIFSFMEEHDVPVKLLLPKDMVEAENMYQQWLQQNAECDSAVLVVGNSEYVNMLKRSVPKLNGRGSRVLLFESDETIEGVSTVMVGRYGVSYLAGTMSKEFDTFILAATSGIPSLEEAIKGFSDGHREAGDGTREVTLQYLADGEEGFAMADSAYHTLYKRAEQYWSYDEMIFPLLGGSEAGIIKYLNSEDLNQALSIGMDVNKAGQSTRIPFSMVIHVDKVIKLYLDNWIVGENWPATQRFGLSDGMADIAMTPHFFDNVDIWDDRYDDNDTFLNLYKYYYEQAKKKEYEYKQQK